MRHAANWKLLTSQKCDLAVLQVVDAADDLDLSRGFQFRQDRAVFPDIREAFARTFCSVAFSTKAEFF